MIKANKNGTDLIIDFGSKALSVRNLIENYMTIISDRGEEIKLKFNAPQEKLFFEIVKCVQDERPVRFVILKARQLGFTTFIAGLFFVLTMFQSNKRAIIIANKGDNASMIFSIYQNFYKNLPPELKGQLKSDNAKKIESAVYGSSIRIIAQGDNAGRGGRFDFAHISEAAFFDDLKNTVLSITQSVHFTNKETMIFMESTANGFNDFKDYYDGGLIKDSMWRSLFFAWYSGGDFKAKYDGFELLPHEQALADKFHLNMEQIAWYRNKYLEVNRDLEMLKQENPSEPLDAFITTGNSVFNLERIAKRKEEILKNTPISKGYFTYSTKGSTFEDTIISNEKFVKNKEGEITIYKLPVPTHPYIIGIDPARAKGVDYTVMQVVDNSTLEQVAVYRKSKEDIDICSITAICLGRMYNNALLIPETNSTESMVKLFQKSNYPNIYVRQTSDASFNGALYEMFGVKTSVVNKKTMVDLGVEICRENNYCNINDYRTICEMENFVYETNETTGASRIKGIGKTHDDCVMSLLIAYYGRNQMSASIGLEVEQPKKQLAYDPLDLNKGYVEDDMVEEAFNWND